LRPTRTQEPSLSQKIAQYASNPTFYGQLQLVIGSVGSGKSTFIRRYYKFLMPDAQRAKTLWAFIDFNQAPDDLAGRRVEAVARGCKTRCRIRANAERLHG